MGKIKQTTVKRTLKTRTRVDSQGRVHCKTCGAFIGNKGKKK